MPTEPQLLAYQELPFFVCPACGDIPFRPFSRGGVQRHKRFLGFLWKQDYCSVICSRCMATVGHESPRITLEEYAQYVSEERDTISRTAFVDLIPDDTQLSWEEWNEKVEAMLKEHESSRQ